MTINRALAVAAAMIAIYCVIQFAGVKPNESGRDLFSCGFEKMRGHYITTRRELERDSDTIFVSQKGREFMFSRRFLGVCVEQTVEKLDE